MVIRSSLWVAFALAVCVSLAACGSTESGPTTDSGSHWLSMCETSDDCGDLSCVCGICTRECEAASACDELEGAACVAPTEAICGEPAPAATICVVECADDGDCPTIDGESALCGDGLCVRGGDPGPDPEECTEVECGPAPGMPSMLCDDGVTWAGPGPCVRDAAGTCGWTIIECPARDTWCYSDEDCSSLEQCTAIDECLPDPSCPECDVCTGDCVPREATTCDEAECGMRPGLPAVLCEDGTMAGLGDCVDLDGTCRWQITTCPEDRRDADCDETECGEAPGIPNLICEDGSNAGPHCRLGAAGLCEWAIEECP